MVLLLADQQWGDALGGGGAVHNVCRDQLGSLMYTSTAVLLCLFSCLLISLKFKVRAFLFLYCLLLSSCLLSRNYTTGLLN